uniref:Uncharacterized protein n=1 Tax=Lepeophtheirus salmonis TaxID=72036 RepID=A0A0K2UZW4_LEPSM
MSILEESDVVGRQLSVVRDHSIKRKGKLFRQIAEATCNIYDGRRITRLLLTRLMDERKVCSFEEFDGEILIRARDENNFKNNEMIVFEQEWAENWNPELSHHDANSRLLPHIFGQ